MKLLELNHVEKSFGDLSVLKDISIHVEEGEILSSVDQVENEDVFTLRLSDGTLDCRVEGKRRQ